MHTEKREHFKNYEFHRKWITDAFHYWDDLRKSADAPLAGVCQLSGYIFSTTSPAIVRVS
mgnify:CR=1 FL=1